MRVSCIAARNFPKNKNRGAGASNLLLKNGSFCQASDVSNLKGAEMRERGKGRREKGGGADWEKRLLGRPRDGTLHFRRDPREEEGWSERITAGT